MRTQDEVVGKAGLLKQKLLNRGRTMEQTISALAKSRAGLIRKINDERQETMERDLRNLTRKQEIDAIKYATLRWALGVTDDIDPENLELDT